MTTFQIILLVFLIICTIAVSFTRELLNAVLVYMSFSLIMSIVWVTLESPDLAITEAAVGAGVTSVLFFITLKKIHAIDTEKEARKSGDMETDIDMLPEGGQGDE
ncbi:MAG: DUF4040 domain-containing protein [Lachnospiraceae bacterium]|nr:DUF4040 domain-containing protein [Candidatus Colinaster scatohippi]